jgi:spore maturation protein A
MKKGVFSMIMSWIFIVFLVISSIFSLFSGNSLGAAVTQGAQSGLTLAISIGGSLCLWSGVGHLMHQTGLTALLANFMRPVLHRIFPSSAKDPELSGALSGNICANLLGLGNAATPMGILSAKRLVRQDRPHIATDELCRLIVLNTASIQLIPANVAAVRVSLGCATPFDILPAVWLTSLCSAGLGVTAAVLLGKVWKND